MKKLILTMSLVLIILASFLTSTLAIYTKTVEITSPGNVIAKDFVFIVDGTETFQSDVKIAPEETVTFSFGVRNYDDAIVTDTSMRYDLTINVGPAPHKTAIGPLVVTVKDALDHVLSSVTCTGTLNISNVFHVSTTGQRHAYKIEFFWPSTANDINFQGEDFSTQINVSATGTQIVEGGGSTNPTDPTNPGELNTYPGTNIRLSSNSVWPDPPHTQDMYTLNKGLVFKYSDNNYYVITKTWDIWKGNAALGPYEITSRRWDGVVRVSGKTLTTADVSGGKFYLADIGDIYDDGNGNYYIYTSYNGRDAKVPSSPDSYNWFKLPTR